MRKGLRSIWLTVACVVAHSSIAFGEGTAQLMPSGSGSSCIAYVQGNDGNGKEGPSYSEPASEYLYVHITDAGTEMIYLGFTRLLPTNKPIYYQVLRPDGSILCSGEVARNASMAGYIADDGVEAYVGPLQLNGAGSGGYQAIECQPDTVGDFAIRFNVNDPVNPTPNESKYYLHPLDITVGRPADSATLDGRLFAYRWHLNTNSGSNRACMDFYTWTPDSLVVKMDMNGIQPYGFTVSFNSFGAQNTGSIADNRKSTSTVSSAVPEYRVFLNEPDLNVYPTGTPGEITYIDINGCQIDSSFCIVANATKIGEINVYIDLTGNGQYDEGTRDVYFPYQNDETGVICIPWDGIDGLGNPVGITESGSVIVQFLAGIVHYPVYDPENHQNGFNCEVVRPSGMNPLMYFDNRDTDIGTYNLDGCSSGCNVWTGGDGDRIMVNTWINTITSEDIEGFSMNGLCAPGAVQDSTCTYLSHPSELSILNNDWDRDNGLDPGSVTLFDLSHDPAQYYYDQSSQVLRLIPSDGDSTTMTLRYRVCDSTDVVDGGPLCDTAFVVMTISKGCTTNITLPLHLPPPQVQAFAGGVRVGWLAGSLPDFGTLYLERADGPQELFQRHWRFQPLPGEVYLDEYLPSETTELWYRWTWIAPDGRAVYSSPVQVQSPPLQPISLQQARWDEQYLTVRYRALPGTTLGMYDHTGRTLWQLTVSADEQTLQVPIHRLPLGPGPWLLLLSHPQGKDRHWLPGQIRSQ